MIDILGVIDVFISLVERFCSFVNSYVGVEEVVVIMCFFDG